jgi:hypothetical protein
MTTLHYDALAAGSQLSDRAAIGINPQRNDNRLLSCAAANERGALSGQLIVQCDAIIRDAHHCRTRKTYHHAPVLVSAATIMLARLPDARRAQKMSHAPLKRGNQYNRRDHERGTRSTVLSTAFNMIVQPTIANPTLGFATARLRKANPKS